MATDSSESLRPTHFKPKIYASPFGNIKRVFRGNIAEFILNSPYLSKAHPDSPLYIEAATGEVQTVSQFKDDIGHLAYVLNAKYRLARGDVLCIFAANHLFTATIHHACHSLGTVVSPSNIMYISEELKHQLDATNTKVIVTLDQHLATVEAACKLSKSPPQIVLIPDLVTQLRAEEMSLRPIKIADPENTDAYYCFSSGTSGNPKGVMTSHFNMTSNTQQQIQAGCFFGAQQVMGGSLPMSHIFGLNQYLFVSPYKNIPFVNYGSFDLENFLTFTHKYKVSLIHIVPPIAVLLAKSPVVDKHPALSKVMDRFVSGAAPLSDDLARAVKRRTGVAVFQAYGLTESSPVSTTSCYKLYKYKRSSIGWLVPSQEARLVDPVTGRDAPRGELWMRGPNIMRGYLNNMEATRETFSDDGWFKTGDVAVIDRSGQLYIVDRIKELIKSKGHQVAPSELETILLGHPLVDDVAVTGVYIEEDATELPRAFVKLGGTSKGPSTAATEILKWMENKVARHKRLWGGIVFVDDVPKSPSGKILRRLLKDRKGDFAYGYSEKPKAKL